MSHTHTSQTTLDLDKIICCKNFSRLQRLLRVTGYVLRFVERCKSRTRASEMIETRKTELAAADVTKAETLWVRELQRELLQHKDFQNWKKQFDLFLEGEVRRCRGRLGNSDIPYSTKHPILLMKSYHLAVLIVQDAHERVMHNGIKETLTEIRSKYWIIKGRQFVRQIIHKCIICRKLEGVPCALPPPLHYLISELRSSHLSCIQVLTLQAPLHQNSRFNYYEKGLDLFIYMLRHKSGPPGNCS